MDKEPFPTLFRFPSLKRFVILDIETTGLDEEAQPFQFAGIKVEDWQILEYFNRYANAPLKDIPFSLRKKLHLEEVEEKILSAPPVEEVAKDFLSFISDFPIIAHNVWFDIEFLRRFQPDLSNPFLDSIELFFLAFPLLTSYALEELSKQEGVEGEISLLQRELGLKKLFPHDALYDCLALYSLLRKAVERLKNSHSASLLHFLAPIFSQHLGLSKPSMEKLSSLLPPPLIPEQGEIREEEYNFQKSEVLKFYDKWVEMTRSERRASQREMVEKVWEIFHNGVIGMIEAPTGTGKTLAYLLPSVFLVRRGGGKVIVATYTKHLQNQVLSDLENKLAGYLPFERPIKYVLLKGQGNYICLRSLFGRMEDAFLNFPEQTGDEEKFLIVYLFRFLEEVKEKIEDLDAIPYLLSKKFPFLATLKENIKSNREICQYKKCPYYNNCFFYRARNAAKEADIVITNHWRLLKGKWESQGNHNLVIDEAHNLEESATDAFSEEVNKGMFATFLALLLSEDGRRGLLPKIARVVGNTPEVRGMYAGVKDLWEVNDEMGKTLYAFLLSEGKRLHQLYGASLWLRIPPGKRRKWWGVIKKVGEFQRGLEKLERYKDTLGEFLRAIAPRLYEELDTAVKNLSERASQLKKLLNWDYDKERRVRWIEVNLLREEVEVEGLNPEELVTLSPSELQGKFLNWSVRDAPVRVGEDLEERLYQVFRSVVLTSATLTVAEKGFRFFLDRLGLEGHITDEYLISLPPVFNYKENVLLALPYYLPSDASQRNIEQFKRDVLEELAEFISYVEGRTLVLFAARDRLEWVGEALEPILTDRKLPLYWQRTGFSKRQMLKEFKEVEEATLMGLRSLWEGVDVPGASLCYLIVEKLPFPSLGDPLIQARREDVRRRGEDEFAHYLLPLSLILFKQGFGRLIRSRSDRGVVLFLDRRLRADVATREMALGTLPGFTRLEEIEMSRKALYEKVRDHMAEYYKQRVAPNFPWEEKLERVKEVEHKPVFIPPEKFPLLQRLEGEGSFLLETTDLSLLVHFFLQQDRKVAIISRTDPFLNFDTPFKEELVYLSTPPIGGVKKLLQGWHRGKIKAVALHPYWLEFEDMKESLKDADAIIVPNVLSLQYSSTFFDPLLRKNIPQIKRKIFLLPPLLREHLDGEPPFLKEMEFISLGESVPSLTFGRTKDIFPLLIWAQEVGKNALIYKPWDGQKLEEELNKMGFLARWGEDLLPLFQKDEFPILILPPGQKADKEGIGLVIHYPPIGDKLSYLMEASQAGGEDGGGYALSCWDRETYTSEMINSMFPDEKNIEEMMERLESREEFLLEGDSSTLRALRILHLLFEEGKADWAMVEREVEMIRLGYIGDKKLRGILEEAGISDKRTKGVDLEEISEKSDIPLSRLSSLIRGSWREGELSYRVKKWGILVRRKSLRGSLPQLPISREEILGEWQELQRWVSSLPLLLPPSPTMR